ncbi:MAG: helix-turn-helix domain-containing protein [Catenulispora sp.]|nr:helix-turn-helix domain-containing protein [Catenulispora sp.]
MSAALDRHAYAELTTAEVAARDAFAYWRSMISAAFVPLTAEPVAGRRFRGRIVHVPVADLELSTVTASSQHVRRTRPLIARSGEEYLLASIQLRGHGRVEQDDRTALLAVGDIAFYDSTRPYTLHFDDPFQQLVVQVPTRQLPLRDTRRLTARTIGGFSPVTAFFVSLARSARENPGGSGALFPHALGLLTAAASAADRSEIGQVGTDALLYEQVVDHLRRHADDPRLDAATVASGCGISRRTLYRIVGADGVATRLRRIRIERAQAMLLDSPDRPVGSVATACGFDSESGFYRAFRAATGMTPGQYRELGTGRQ